MARPTKQPADGDARNIPVLDENGNFVRDINGNKKMRAAASTRCDLSVNEKLHVQAQAKAAGLSEAEFVRRRVLGYSVPPARSLADAALISEINRIGVNVNQLARADHRGSDFVHFWRGLGQEVSRVLKQVSAEHGS